MNYNNDIIIGIILISISAVAMLLLTLLMNI